MTQEEQAQKPSDLAGLVEATFPRLDSCGSESGPPVTAQVLLPNTVEGDAILKDVVAHKCYLQVCHSWL